MLTHRVPPLVLFIALLCLACGRAEECALVRDGKAAAVIVVPPDTMIWEGHDKHFKARERYRHVELIHRRMLRDSVRDLAHYLGKSCGVEFEIITTRAEDDKRLPIYLGAAAQKIFGPIQIEKPHRHGFRVVVDPKRGIGLYGESRYGTSFAIYEWLHRLGCRWFMPSELGECIPAGTIQSLPAMDEAKAPATEFRSIQLADEDFCRRNRLMLRVDGIEQHHALETYISPEQLEEHPEWYLHNANGEIRGSARKRNRFRWTRKDVAEAVANTIIAQLDKYPKPSVSLSAGDYVRYTEDPEERKYDPEPRVWEPAAGRWSVTDRLVMLANRVAERVGRKYPDVLFGMYAYVNYSMPPAREKVHPNVIPIIAPIDFNRHHPMTWKDHPNKDWLIRMVEGWAKAAGRIGYYAYGMNLAEITAPYPLITKWGTDIPILMKNHLAFWTPENMTGWESAMPGYYLSFRLTFDPSEKPEAILKDLWKRFYGAAADPMERYWRHIDRAWIDAREYSGCGFGYLRMFTPEVMQKARAFINEALAACQTIPEFRRVQIVDESFALFELFMKMRENFAEGRFNELQKDIDLWRASREYLSKRYRPQCVLVHPYSTLYVNLYFARSYEDAAKMEKDFRRHGKPMMEWKYRYNPGSEEDSLPWTAVDYDDGEWKTTHVVRETWSTIGHHNTMTDEASGRSGRMVYRTTQKLKAAPKGKRVFLWIGATDGSVKLFVNGQHVKYVILKKTRKYEKGTELDAFSGYCQPVRFDVTEVLRKGNNQFTILAERTNLNELGTGGLMGPVVLYRER